MRWSPSAAGRPRCRGLTAELNVVYTPMHGVAGPLMLRAIGRRASRRRTWWRRRRSPTRTSRPSRFPIRRSRAPWTWRWPTRGGSAPTWCWPATRTGTGWPWPCPIRRGGGWRVLTGDQVGALLGASLLERTAGGMGRDEGEAAPRARLVASTVVSSTLLSKIAAAAGVRYAETLTGFKWIARAADGMPGTRFVFGYEEALGYAVGDVVRDKDGIGAALAMLGLAEMAKAQGRSVLGVYDDLETGARRAPDLPADPADGRPGARHEPAQVGAADRPRRPAGDRPGRPRRRCARPGRARLPRADVLIFRLPGARVVLRPERHRAEDQVLHRDHRAARGPIAGGRPRGRGRAPGSAADRPRGDAGGRLTGAAAPFTSE